MRFQFSVPNHKIFNPRKYRTVIIQPSVLFMFSASVNHICSQFICCSLWYYLSLVHSSLFCFVRSTFVRLFSVWLLDYSVLFSVLILELYSSYFDQQNHISTTIRQVNEHHTQDCAMFFLSKRRKSLLPL
jgi:hypothetical protein